MTAVPDAGYEFVDWSDSSTDNPRTDSNVTADISVTANFAAHVAPVVINTNDMGPGSLRKALADVEDGDTITFDFGPSRQMRRP